MTTRMTNEKGQHKLRYRVTEYRTGRNTRFVATAWDDFEGRLFFATSDATTYTAARQALDTMIERRTRGRGIAHYFDGHLVVSWSSAGWHPPRCITQDDKATL